MENDLLDVVSVLERIETELKWYEKNTAASQIIDALNSIEGRLINIESGLRDVELAVKALEK